MDNGSTNLLLIYRVSDTNSINSSNESHHTSIQESNVKYQVELESLLAVKVDRNTQQITMECHGGDVFVVRFLEAQRLESFMAELNQRQSLRKNK